MTVFKNEIDLGSSNVSCLLVTRYQKVQVRWSCTNYRYVHSGSMHQKYITDCPPCK